MTINDIRSVVFRKEIIIHILYWLFHFTSVNTEWGADWTDPDARNQHVAQLTVLLIPVFFYLNAFWLIPGFLKGKKWYRYFFIVALILLITETGRSLVYTFLKSGTSDFFINFSTEITGNDNLVFGLPNTLFSAFLFSFAYRFTKDWITNKQLIEKLKTEKLTMELNLLKSQINPHFLFNNLNTLDDLIDRDTAMAKAYLHRLSKIYRYSITNLENDVVTLQEEWDYIDDYIYLIEERFGKVYEFSKECILKHSDQYLIPPASLQMLVENVVKHNHGSIDNPLKVTIKADESGISVIHKKRPKKSGIKSLGTGLKNLVNRYQLLVTKEIEILDSDSFSVKLPLINQIN